MYTILKKEGFLKKVISHYIKHIEEISNQYIT
jgi:hypothetical protein